MVIAIGVLAGLLFVLGLGLVISAINLLPTDLGLVYLQGGITFITGAAIILAIAFSTRHNRRFSAHKRSLKSTAMRRENAPDVAPSAEQAMVIGLPASAAMAAAGMAGGVATYGGGEQSLAPSETIYERDPRTQAVLEAFERDLGLELAQMPQELPVSPESEPLPSVQDVPALAITPPPPASLQDDEEDELLMFNLPPLPKKDASLPDDAALLPEMAPAPAAPMPEVPGLLPDDDLVSLAEAAEPLAPLETLEEVGSYESAGTKFTMYSDGSVVTSNPEGQNRYRTLDDLRAFLATK